MSFPDLLISPKTVEILSAPKCLLTGVINALYFEIFEFYHNTMQINYLSYKL